MEWDSFLALIFLFYKVRTNYTALKGTWFSYLGFLMLTWPQGTKSKVKEGLSMLKKKRKKTEKRIQKEGKIKKKIKENVF